MKQSESLFLGLIYSLQAQAMSLMGKAKSSSVIGANDNFELAKINIEVIEELVKKTEGNLTEEEEKILNGVIKDLRIEYSQNRVMYN